MPWFRRSVAVVLERFAIPIPIPIPIRQGVAADVRRRWSLGRVGRQLTSPAMISVVSLLLASKTLEAAEPPGPPVAVSLKADTPSLLVGTKTTVRVFARVTADFQASTDRIFTWNLDFLVLSPEVGTLDSNTLVRPSSDQDPILGSAGTLDGPNLLGIRDSFLNREGAGVTAPVELFSVQIQGVSPGTLQLRVRPGTIGSEDSPDFLVLPTTEDDPWTGADYAAATVELPVGSTQNPSAPRVSVERMADGRVRVSVTGDPGSTVALEETETTADIVSWRRVGQGSAGSGSFVHELAPVGTLKFFRGVRTP